MDGIYFVLKNFNLTCSFKFSQSDIVAFALTTGDHNPLHLDEEFASRTVFKRPIVQGLLAGSIFTKFLQSEFPCNGFIYTKQTFEFLRPMYVDVEYEVTFCVQHIDTQRRIAEIFGEIRNVSSRKVTLRGVTTIMLGPFD